MALQHAHLISRRRRFAAGSHRPSLSALAGTFDQITRLILVVASRIGTIVPRKIVPAAVPLPHGFERGFGDKFASRASCPEADARGVGRPSRSQQSLLGL